MAELPRVDQQNSGSVLKDRKTMLGNAKKELEATQAALKEVLETVRQNTFYEREIDGARGRIFMLMIAQLRHAEADHSEQFVAQVLEGIELLVLAEKKKATLE